MNTTSGKKLFTAFKAQQEGWMSLRRSVFLSCIFTLHLFLRSDSVVSVVLVPVSQDKAVKVNNSNNYHPAAQPKICFIVCFEEGQTERNYLPNL